MRLRFERKILKKSLFRNSSKALKYLKHSLRRSREQALAFYLFWLKSRIPQNIINDIFGIKLRQKVCEYCS